MDERKKAIAGLEAKKQEALSSLNLIFEDFGETLFTRIYGQGEPATEHATWAPSGAQEYLKLKKDIADSEQLIRITEAETLRLKELESYIQGKEGEYAALSREAAEARAELGRHIHGDPAFAGVTDPYQDRLDALMDKIRVNELKLDQLDGQAGANIFSWIGRSAQALTLRIFLKRDQANLEKVYESLGSRLLRSEHNALVSSHEVAGLAGDARDLKERVEALKGELTQSRSERRKLNSSFAAEGGALRRIQGLERHIAQVKGELKSVYRRFGEEAADPAKTADFAHILGDSDAPVLEKTALSRKTIGEYDREIEKLKTAIAIDDEKAGIEKMRKSIGDHRERIKASEGAITDLEGRIVEAEKHISELERLL
jgi:chromosome segregation ATPase